MSLSLCHTRIKTRKAVRGRRIWRRQAADNVDEAFRSVGVTRKRTVERVICVSADQNIPIRGISGYHQGMVKLAIPVRKLNHVTESGVSTVGYVSERADTGKNFWKITATCHEVEKFIHARPGGGAAVGRKEIPAEGGGIIHFAATRQYCLRNEVRAVAAHTREVREKGIS